jgi:hypothetical protein
MGFTRKPQSRLITGDDPMRPLYRWTAIAATLFATTLAAAAGAPTAGNNPLNRNQNIFNGSLGAGPLNGAPLNTSSGLGRPPSRFGPAVNPVPEPSQWLMMLAGLGILGFIARRGSTRS